MTHLPECPRDPCTCGNIPDAPEWQTENKPALAHGEWTIDQVNERDSAGRPVLDFTRDPAEEACYDIQKACWSFQKSIEQADTAARIAFIDGMLAESRKRLEIVIVALGAKQATLEEPKS